MNEREKMLHETHESQLSEAIKLRDALVALVNGPGWVIVNAWLQEEIDNRRRLYEQSAPHTMNDASIIGYQRAQLGMLRTLQDVPTKLLEAEQDAIDQMTVTTGYYNGDS